MRPESLGPPKLRSTRSERDGVESHAKRDKARSGCSRCECSRLWGVSETSPSRASGEWRVASQSGPSPCCALRLRLHRGVICELELPKRSRTHFHCQVATSELELPAFMLRPAIVLKRCDLGASMCRECITRSVICCRSSLNEPKTRSDQSWIVEDKRIS